ncbi:MAG: transposase [bacterium]
MAIIMQQNLFSWQDVEELGDLERLKLVIETMPDGDLIQALEKRRKGKRDDYPIIPMWNSVLAGVIYQHPSIESLRRELQRNGQLRQMCGFDPLLGIKAVPSKDAYHRFLKGLLSMQDEIDKIFHGLIEELRKLLADFGEHLAVDSKSIATYARDNSSDPDADWGVKRYRGVRKDGSLWEKVKKWFGYKLHLIVDTTYELPIGYRVTRASASDGAELLPMIEESKDRHPELIERAKDLSGDKGYDSWDNNQSLWDEFAIKPVIDIRDMWKEEKLDEKLKGEEGSSKDIITRSLYPDRVDNIVYDYKGSIYCYCPVSDQRREMAYQGFEKDRNSLKYRCPVSAYGIECQGKQECSGNGYGRIVRIPLERDRRIFTPIARSSYAWERLYKGRTAVERVNSRMDNVFGFENHFIRGKAKMTLRISLALVVMLSMAVGRIRQKQAEKMRSLVQLPRAA